jgi:uncharacterized cupredoxin-like copper-binding protein
MNDSILAIGGRPARLGAMLAALLAALLLAVSACSAGGGTVPVTLQEWSVQPAKPSVSAGKVTFDVKNEGPDDPHELVVIKTDLAPDQLPTDADGKVDEVGAGIEFIGEIEEFDPGQSESATFELKAGKYVFICNIVETEADGTKEAHYKLGMRAPFMRANPPDRPSVRRGQSFRPGTSAPRVGERAMMSVPRHRGRRAGFCERPSHPDPATRTSACGVEMVGLPSGLLVDGWSAAASPRSCGETPTSSVLIPAGRPAPPPVGRSAAIRPSAIRPPKAPTVAASAEPRC